MSSLMQPTTIEFAFASGVGGFIAVFMVGFLAWVSRSYLGSYLKEKAANFATKQDIQALTRLQEEVKAEFDQMLESQRTEAQLRLAVIEKRFQAHQKAHTLWFNLVRNVHGDRNVHVALECQTWWQENSLYLDQNARIAFIKATNAAFDHPVLLNGPRDDKHTKVIKENWQTIIDAGSVIEAAVNLPSLDISEVQNPKPTAMGYN